MYGVSISISPFSSKENKKSFPIPPLLSNVVVLFQSEPQSFSVHYGHGGKRSGEPWNKSDSDWFQLKKKKRNKHVSDWSIQGRKREWVNVRRVWRVSGVFSCYVRCQGR